MAGFEQAWLQRLGYQAAELSMLCARMHGTAWRGRERSSRERLGIGVLELTRAIVLAEINLDTGPSSQASLSTYILGYPPTRKGSLAAVHRLGKIRRGPCRCICSALHTPRASSPTGKLSTDEQACAASPILAQRCAMMQRRRRSRTLRDCRLCRLRALGSGAMNFLP